MKFLSTVLLALASSSTPATSHEGHDPWGWDTLDAKLPKSLSDHTAVIDSSSGNVFIAGGCDASDGNIHVPAPGENGDFVCGSVSTSFFQFSTETLQFETLADIPRQRYRHASAVVNNQVWLLGGRDVDDNLIPEVDIFDITEGSWSTFTLPEKYVVSDHTAFGKEEGSSIYIVGGFADEYVAQTNMGRITLPLLGDEATTPITVEDVATLAEARGDIVGTVSTDGSKAFVSGGFTHDNGFCSPLESTEEYDFATNSWTTLAPLNHARGEIVLTELDNHLYALGGERQIEGICDLVGGSTDPGELTVGTDLVETFDRDGGDWEVISPFPDQKFRFAAVSVESQGRIYTFGGQTAYSEDCSCFKTTDTVAVFGEGLSSSPGALFRSGLPLVGLAFVISAIFMM